jgi:undecaprenyl-diphosphatase
LTPQPVHDRRRRDLQWALLVAGLAGFVGLALAYDHAPLSGLDNDVARWVAADLPSWVVDTARPFSWLGGWIGLTALGAVVVVALLRERAWVDLAFFLLAVLGSQLGVALLKAVFERPRPDAGSAVPLPDSFAFPSGHAAAGAASFGAAAVLLAERLPSARARAWLWVGAIVLGVGIGLSRIALGVHYLTDVLAGWCIGLAWLATCLLVRDGLRDAADPGSLSNGGVAAQPRPEDEHGADDQ